MKRFLTAIAFLMAGSGLIGANAENGRTDGFKGYWDMHVKGGVAHTVGEAKFGELLSPAASAGFGYHFTPVWGLRADFSGWQAKGAAVYPPSIYRFNFVQANADVTIDICSIFAGYRPERVLNPYLLVGAGANIRFGNDGAATALNGQNPDYIWDGTKICPAGRAGLGLGIRLTDLVGINIEVNSNILSDKFNSKPGSKLDFQSNALIGLNFSFGKAPATTCSCCKSAAGGVAAAATAEAAAAAALAASEQNSKDEEKKNVAEGTTGDQVTSDTKNTAKAASCKESVKYDIFFTIGSWTVSQTEAKKVNELIEFLKNNPSSKVSVIGHADKDTGGADRNLFLSKQRANFIGKMLEDAGINKDRISIEFKGASENPYDSATKNRVAVCIAK